MNSMRLCGKIVFFSTLSHIVPHRQYIENEGPAREVQWAYDGNTVVIQL